MRQLRSEEIKKLEHQHCRADNWRNLRVAENFSVANIYHVSFRGECQIGELHHNNSGIEDTRLTNAIIHDHVEIRSSNIENYEIGAGAKIINTTQLQQARSSTFANGEKVAVMVESGGREINLHQDLSAPLVWLEVFANMRQQYLWEKFASLVANEKRSDHGVVGTNAKIIACGIIDSVRVGDHAEISNCQSVRNATINGIVNNATAISDSIIAQNGYVGTACIVTKCFVADGAIIDNGLRAKNSLFFANCDCQRGEIDSVIAAPYTVSHHQSTLLLASLCSFFNAGSGANFSNHRYKLGAWHQGIFERGCKCGSNSYLLFPTHLGAFNTIIGNHPRSLNTAMFPFSLIIEQNNSSVLLPGANIATIGLLRDEHKWQARDRRHDKTIDCLQTAIFNPLLAEQLERALKMLQKYKGLNENITHHDAEIPHSYLEKATAKYRMALNYYYGLVIAQGIRAGRPTQEIPPRNEEWFDLCGMVATKNDGDYLIEQMNVVKNYQELRAVMNRIHERYADNEWQWVVKKILSDNQTLRDAQATTLQNWRSAARLRLELLRRDAEKEFAPTMRIGYGEYNLATQNEEYLRVHNDLAHLKILNDETTATTQMDNEIAMMLKNW